MVKKSVFFSVFLVSIFTFIFQLSNNVYAAEYEISLEESKYEEMTSSDVELEQYSSNMGKNIALNDSIIYAVSDDYIVNIVPKELFTNEGTYAYYGSEYGFIIQTTYDSQNKMFKSTVIALDFDVTINTNVRGAYDGYVYSYNITQPFCYNYLFLESGSEYKILDYDCDYSVYNKVILEPNKYNQYSNAFSYEKSKELYVKNSSNSLLVSNLNELNAYDSFEDEDDNSKYGYSLAEDNGCYIVGSYFDYSFGAVKVYETGYGSYIEGFDSDAYMISLVQSGIEMGISAIPIIGVIWDYGSMIYDAISAGFENYEEKRVVYENENYVYKTDLKYFGAERKIKLASQSVPSPIIFGEQFMDFKGITFSYLLAGVEREKFDPTRFSAISLFEINDKQHKQVKIENVGYSQSVVDSTEYFDEFSNTISKFNYSSLSAKNSIDSYISFGIDTKLEIDLNSLYSNDVFAEGYYTIEKVEGLADFDIIVDGQKVDSIYISQDSNGLVSIRGKDKYDYGKLKLKLVPYKTKQVEAGQTISLEGSITKISIDSDVIGIPNTCSLLNENMIELRFDFEDSKYKYYFVQANSIYYFLNANTNTSANITFASMSKLMDGENNISIGLYYYDCLSNSEDDIYNFYYKNNSMISSNDSKVISTNEGYFYVMKLEYKERVYFICKSADNCFIKKGAPYISVENSSFDEIEMINGEYEVQRGKTYYVNVHNAILINYVNNYDGIVVENEGNRLKITINEDIQCGRYDISFNCYDSELDYNDGVLICSTTIYLRVEIGDNLEYSLNTYRYGETIYMNINVEKGLSNKTNYSEYAVFELNINYYDINKGKNYNKTKQVRITSNSKITESIIQLPSIYNDNSIGDIDLALNNIVTVTVGSIKVGQNNIIFENDIIPAGQSYSKQYNFLLGDFDSRTNAYNINYSREFLNAMYLIDNYNNYLNFNLNNDLYFDLYTYISVEENYYGTFNGNNYCIERLKLNNNPIFKNLYGEICNLELYNYIDTEYSYHALSVVAQNNYGVIRNFTVNNSAYYDIESETFSGYVVNNHGTIDSCKIYIPTNTVVNSNSFSGYVYDNYGTVKNCSYYFNSNSINSHFGGIAINNYSQISDCKFTGNITSSDSSIGGICLTNSASGSIIDSTCSANFTSDSYYLDIYFGGIVAYNYGKIDGCLYDKAINVDSKYAQVGGIVAYNIGETLGLVTNCEANGAIFEVQTYSSSYVGGIIGYTIPSYDIYVKTDNSIIENCFVTNCNINGNKVVGGIVGVSNGKVIDCTVSSSTKIYSSDGPDVGGIAGIGNILEGNVCYANITVSSKSATISAGGIVGSLGLNDICNDNIYYGTISTSSPYARTGGIVGYAGYATVSSNDAYGCISGKGNTGGIAGSTSQSDIYYNYSTTTISYEPESATSVGGIVGDSSYCDVYSNTSLSRIYINSSPNVFYVGGIVGKISNGKLRYNNFNNGVISYDVSASQNQSLKPYIGQIVGYAPSSTSCYNNYKSGITFNVSKLISFTTGSLWWKKTHNQLQYCDTDGDGFGSR